MKTPKRAARPRVIHRRTYLNHVRGLMARQDHSLDLREDDSPAEPAVPERPFYDESIGDYARARIAHTVSSSGAKTWRVHTEITGVAALKELGVGRTFHEYYDAASRELAIAVVVAAEEQLRARKNPDLPRIADDLKRRDRALVTLDRRAYGDKLVAGDTAPDEQPKS